MGQAGPMTFQQENAGTASGTVSSTARLLTNFSPQLSPTAWTLLEDLAHCCAQLHIEGSPAVVGWFNFVQAHINNYCQGWEYWRKLTVCPKIREILNQLQDKAAPDALNYFVCVVSPDSGCPCFYKLI